MYPDPFIAGKYVTLYGIMIALGIVACILFLRYLGKKRQIDPKFLDFVELNGYASIAVGFGTAYLFQLVYDWIKTGEFSFRNHGITFLGGLIGGVATFLIIYNIMKKKYSARIASILPIAPICITIAHAFGRVGCFFAGCCYGRIAEEGELFYFTAVQFKYLDGLRYPTNLFEAIFLFVLCGIMLLLLLKKNFKYNFIIYLPAYGIWRFLIEYVRADERGQIFPGVDWISPSQFISLIMVLGTIPVYFLIKYLYKNEEINPKEETREDNNENKEELKSPEN
ncbi:MAG: prolipoprotein diacylglyceryl transferase [Bacilli bacterium]|nr:prolipoprotein diacylglyceryl transferase [Bacilli bacterium]